MMNKNSVRINIQKAIVIYYMSHNGVMQLTGAFQ